MAQATGNNKGLLDERCYNLATLDTYLQLAKQPDSPEDIGYRGGSRNLKRLGHSVNALARANF